MNESKDLLRCSVKISDVDDLNDGTDKRCSKASRVKCDVESVLRALYKTEATFLRFPSRSYSAHNAHSPNKEFTRKVQVQDSTVLSTRGGVPSTP
jgi:hypothetical protein